VTDSTVPRRTELLTAGLDAAPSIDRVRVAKIELAPGQVPGAHHHPCDVVGTVLSGRIAFEIEGQDPTVLRAGDAFFEPRNTHVVHFDNASEDETATFLACYLMSPGQTEVIVMTPSPHS
jgi:quercetin dioxygenase-like cupin family protein